MLGRKVHSGQRLRMSAEEFNAFTDAAVDLRARQSSRGTRPFPSDTPSPTILVRNDSGQNVPRFGVLGLAGPLITPEDNLSEFQSRIALSGIAPVEEEHEDGFVILAEPLAEGVIGEAFLTGASPVQVEVEDEDHSHATVKDGEVGFLVSTGDEGKNRILWKELGTGLKWALVMVRAAGGGGAERMVVVRSIPDSNGVFIEVQEIKPNTTVPWDGGFVTEGDAVTVNVWPGLRAGDFSPFVWAGALSALMTVLPLSRQHGSWWLKQLPKWAVSARKGPLKVLDCTGVEISP